MIRYDPKVGRTSYLPLVLATLISVSRCGGDAAAVIERSVGEASVLADGRIVLKGCPPSQPVDTRETFAIETPAGSCSQGEPVCDVVTQQWCPGGVAGLLLQWTCHCIEGVWRCTIGESGGQYCSTHPYPTPQFDDKPCTFDPARYRSVACRPDATNCEVTTIQQCPNGSQGKTSRWACRCDTHPTLAPGEHVWACQRTADDGQTCGGNTCPVLNSYSVNPSRAAVGERIELRASARDDDGDEMSYLWTASAGRLVNPATPNTSYTCSASGMVTLVARVSDGACDTSAKVDVECSP